MILGTYVSSRLGDSPFRYGMEDTCCAQRTLVSLGPCSGLPVLAPWPAQQKRLCADMGLGQLGSNDGLK